MARLSRRKRYTTQGDFLFVLKSQEDVDFNNFLEAELKTSKMEELSHEKMDELWDIVHNIFACHRDNILSNGSHTGLKTDQEPEQQEERFKEKPISDDKIQSKKESLAFVCAVVQKIKEIISLTDPYVPPKMVEVTISLQSFLLQSNINIEPDVKNKIVDLIELWWQARLEIRGSMIILAFTFLLKKTSETAKNVLKTNITRVWKFRESLLKLQLDSAGCTELLGMLSALPENKQYLNSKDGCNFIAFLFTLDVVVVENLHSAVKRALPTSKRVHTNAYGQIYTTAWVKATPEIRSVLEETCLQNFMLHALTLPRHGQEMNRLGQHVTIILNYFHHNRVHPLMRKMVATQYEPLLWRFLCSSNSLHRCNAAQVFFSAYPLKCPWAGAEARTLYEEKQHQAISTMLTDSCHIVRIIATKEVFKVMEQYWQVLPPECIQGWMKIVVAHLATDSSSADVRRLVFVGFHHLLNNAHTVDYIKDIIPKLRLQIHDVNEKVRLAFVNLLLKLKSLDLHYWSFVPLRHIMARLEVENQLIGELLVRLTIDGFYGPLKTHDQKIRRLMGLFILNRGAGRNFFYHSKPSLCTADAVDLAVVVLKTLKCFVKVCVEQDKTIESSMCSVSDSPSQESKKGKGVQDKENIDTVNVSTAGAKKPATVNSTASLDNPVVLHGFLDLVGILWMIHIKDLSQNQSAQLESLCIECMPSFTNFFQGTEFYSSVLFLASLSPSKALSERFHITSMFMSQLKHLTPDDADEAFSGLVQPLCSWNQGSAMLDIVQDCLHEAFTSNLTVSQNHAGRRRVTFRGVQEANPDTALKILNAIFSYEPNQLKILNKNYNQLLELWTDMAQIKDLVAARVVQGTPFESHLLGDGFLQGCLLRYAKLTIILRRENVDFNSCQEFMDLLHWARQSLVPHVPAELPPKGHTGVPLVVALLRDLNYVAINMLVLTVDEPRLCMRVAAYSKDLTKSGCSLMFVTSVSRVIGQLLEVCKSGDGAVDSMKLLRVVTPSLLAAVLGVLSSRYYPTDCVTTHVENISQVKSVMTDVLETCLKFYGISSPLLECLVDKFADTIVAVHTCAAHQVDNPEPAENPPSLLPLVQHLVSVFPSNSLLRDMLLQTLAEERTTRFTEDKVSLTAVTSLVKLLTTKVTRTKRRPQDDAPTTTY